MTRWAFRVAGRVSWRNPPPYFWDDAPIPTPAWVRWHEDRGEPAEWTPNRRPDGTAHRRRLTAARQYGRDLDAERTTMTPDRLVIVGEIGADDTEAAMRCVLDIVRWTLVTIYGWSSDRSATPLPALDVRIRPRAHRRTP